MSFDSLIANPGRLSILTALAVEAEVEFVHLRRVTKLTDGNLSSHAKRLATAGLVDIDKSFRQGKPVTSMKLTPQGRTALETHVRRLLSAMSHRRLETAGSAVESKPDKTQAPQYPEITVVAADEWID
ncbi:MAG: transcriptional regulator [Phycisphaerales bacterium]|jgi:DNA-binding transcriptional ArsR family regulator|nr:transcriptional regulator [Phycisphaerales bacterium]